VAAALDIDTSILSKIERNERDSTKGMIPILAEILGRPEKVIELEFIQSVIESNPGSLKYYQKN
jgi:transcriptional regulator with XRE-family HTH domain